MTMKAQNEQQQAISRCLAKVAEGRVGRNGRKERDLNHEEMQSLLAKLKELVPNMPRNKKVSKLEIIQNVIDYILDLQIALETHPANRSSSHPAGSSTSPARQPLGVLPPSANAVANTCSAQEVCVGVIFLRTFYHCECYDDGPLNVSRATQIEFISCIYGAG
ncbi:hypothetical protein HPB49_004823 [Dermacentor silvarum]|uniref:Uncharacterized protein n=1 Tax=Dermacentor silvarum TaxID=543639 RepID=A0ACB8DMR5_DERSI|nr:hypothetical protein HPB49_004823 [Dermacentor silvarum]